MVETTHPPIEANTHDENFVLNGVKERLNKIIRVATTMPSDLKTPEQFKSWADQSGLTTQINDLKSEISHNLSSDLDTLRLSILKLAPMTLRLNGWKFIIDATKYATPQDIKIKFDEIRDKSEDIGSEVKTPVMSSPNLVETPLRSPEYGVEPKNPPEVTTVPETEKFTYHDITISHGGDPNRRVKQEPTPRIIGGSVLPDYIPSEGKQLFHINIPNNWGRENSLVIDSGSGKIIRGENLEFIPDAKQGYGTQNQPAYWVELGEGDTFSLVSTVRDENKANDRFDLKAFRKYTLKRYPGGLFLE